MNMVVPMKRLISWRTLSKSSELSISTLKRLGKSDPNFPRKIQISPGRVGFYEDEADSWLESLGGDKPVHLGQVARDIVDRISKERRRS